LGSKLVRDRIPEVMWAAGLRPRFRVLAEDERLTWLLEKIREEAEELATQPSLEECADVLEVLLAIAQELGHTRDQVHLAAEKKVELRGAFHKGILLQAGGREE